jgi:hypothetical protein
VSSGDYSLGLDDFLAMLGNVTEEIIRVNLLRRSSAFIQLAARVDQRVVAAGNPNDPISHLATYTDLDEHTGHVISGPHKGKWRLEFDNGVGHRFIPGGSPDSVRIGHTINVDRPEATTGEARGTFVEGMVHETLHLEASLYDRFKPAGTTLGAKLDAFFSEEIWVRQQTLKVMNEVTRGQPKDLQKDTPYVLATPPMARRDVEIDFPSGEERLTYLETAVFDALLSEAIAVEGLASSDVQALRDKAKEESVGPGDRDLLQNIGGFVLVFDDNKNMYLQPTSKTLELLIRRKATQARWRHLFEAATPPDVRAEADKHASLFFPAGIAYTP